MRNSQNDNRRSLNERNQAWLQLKKKEELGKSNDIYLWFPLKPQKLNPLKPIGMRKIGLYSLLAATRLVWLFSFFQEGYNMCVNNERLLQKKNEKKKQKVCREGFVGHFLHFSRKKDICLPLTITHGMRKQNKNKEKRFLSQTLLCEKAKSIIYKKNYQLLCFAHGGSRLLINKNWFFYGVIGSVFCFFVK